MRDLILYFFAALCEIGGCFCFWAWLRLHRSPLWTLPGLVALFAFALTLTLIDAGTAGRAYAAYGGVYILTSLLWLWAVEKTRPDVWDCVGAIICLVGSAIILFGRRATPTG